MTQQNQGWANQAWHLPSRPVPSPYLPLTTPNTLVSVNSSCCRVPRLDTFICVHLLVSHSLCQASPAHPSGPDLGTLSRKASHSLAWTRCSSRDHRPILCIFLSKCLSCCLTVTQLLLHVPQGLQPPWRQGWVLLVFVYPQCLDHPQWIIQESVTEGSMLNCRIQSRH